MYFTQCKGKLHHLVKSRCSHSEMESTLHEWAATLPLSSILASCIAQSEHSDFMELSAVCALSTTAITAIGKLYGEMVTKVLIDAVTELKKALKVSRDLQKNIESYRSSKFSHSFGEIKDFHTTLTDRVGWPNLDFLKGITDEHIRGEPFREKDSDKMIFPKAEFEYVHLGNSPSDELGAGSLRVIPNVDELKKGQTATDAKLSREEVVVTILYTGPMFLAYNEALRGSVGESKYPTTIFLLGSAVTKLTKVQRIPRGIRLYRGYGGGLDFPHSFYEPDVHGCQGITEFGFLSTTMSKEIAIQYSGAKQGKPIPMIIEILVGSVDRERIFANFRSIRMRTSTCGHLARSWNPLAIHSWRSKTAAWSLLFGYVRTAISRP